MQLSDFLRYVIRDTKNNLVELEKEIAYIQNYIDLQQSRLRDSVEVNFALDGQVAGQKVVPLILFSFIENAFKHGVNPEEESKIDIKITAFQNHVELRVYNKKVLVHNPKANAGIGVINAKKRLKLLYPDKHLLTISENESEYYVELTITT